MAPESLREYLPPGAEISVHDGKAWVSVCFVRLRRVRPWPLPGFLGQSFHYFIQRSRALVPYPDGEMRETVLILDAAVDRGLMALAGRVSTGLHFRKRRMKLEDVPGGQRLRLWDRDRTVLYDATVSKPGYTLPSDSRFDSIEKADDFIAGVAFGAEWDQKAGKIRYLAETHDPWDAQVAGAVTRKNWFLEQLGEDAEADHLISLEATPHYFQFGRHSMPMPRDLQAVTVLPKRRRRRWGRRPSPI